MSKETGQPEVEGIAVARNTTNGAMIILNERNRSRLLPRRDIIETIAVRNPETGKLEEVEGGELKTVSRDNVSQALQRIGEQLRQIKAQRESLITSGLKMVNGAEYLTQLKLYDPEEDDHIAIPPTPEATTGVTTAPADTDMLKASGKNVDPGKKKKLEAEVAKSQADVLQDL